MADRYWVNGTGQFNDTSHWSSYTGGVSGATVPTSADNVFFDTGSSPVSGSYTVTLSTNLQCNNISMDRPGVGGAISLSGSAGMVVYGNIDLLGDNGSIVWGNTGAFYIASTAGTITFHSNGAYLLNVRKEGNSTMSIESNIYIQSYFYRNAGVVLFNGNTLIGNGDYSLGLYGLDSTSPIHNLEYIPNASSNYIALNSDISITGNLVTRPSATTERALIKTATAGYTYTLSVSGTIAASGCDFTDIIAGGTTNWDLSAMDNYSGNCGGCSGITFTPAVTAYWKHGATSNTHWTGDTGGNCWYTTSGGSTQSRVPIPQDYAIFDANSFSGTGKTVTFDRIRMPTVVMRGVTNNPTITTSSIATVFGSLYLDSGITLSASNSTYTFGGRGDHFLYSAGKSWAKQINVINPGGSLTLLSDLVTSSSLWLYYGTLSATYAGSSFNVTMSYMTCFSNDPKTLNMGDGTWELTNTASNGLTINSSTTVNPGHSTIKFSGTLVGNMPCGFGSKTLYNFWNDTKGGNFNVTVTGTNVFNSITLSASSRTTFSNASTNTVNTLTAIGSAGAPVYIRNTTSTTHATLAKAGGGTISCEYVNIDYITGSPANTWYMGTNSTDGGHNTNIYFTDPPTPSVGGDLFFANG